MINPATMKYVVENFRLESIIKEINQLGWIYLIYYPVLQFNQLLTIHNNLFEIQD